MSEKTMKPDQAKKQMEEWRRRIDALDQQLVQLLNDRSFCALELGRIKEELKIEIYDPQREEEVIRNAKTAGRQGPLEAGALQRIFERIIDETRSAERRHRSDGDRPGKKTDKDGC